MTLALLTTLTFSHSAVATVLWSHPEAVLVCDNGKGEDILRGAIEPRDRTSVGTLYFRIKVDPISDTAAKVIKTFEAGFMLVEKGQEHLGLGNARDAMAYSALNVPKAPKGFEDLNSRVPDAPFSYEYMRGGNPRYIVWRVEYVPGQDARVTAWLNPDLSSGMTEFNQPTNIVVHFEADARFDEFRLIHRGYGGGWEFSQMLVATSFEDLLIPRFWQRGWFIAMMMTGLLLGVAIVARLAERRRAQRQIQRLERESAVAAERARIARDIHDDVGASLTKISKLTEMMDWKNKAEVDQAAFTHNIAETARDTIRAMDEIVWAINPKNDVLKEMADYLVHYAEEFIRPTGIACELDVPLNVPEIPLTAEVRHNLFMVVKEALHNAVKHAEAGRIKLGLSFQAESRLSIVVSDNGRGFHPDQVASVGNGLENMNRRMHEIGGDLKVESEPGRGTVVTLLLPLNLAKDRHS